MYSYVARAAQELLDTGQVSTASSPTSSKRDDPQLLGRTVRVQHTPLLTESCPWEMFAALAPSHSAAPAAMSRGNLRGKRLKSTSRVQSVNDCGAAEQMGTTPSDASQYMPHRGTYGTRSRDAEMPQQEIQVPLDPTTLCVLKRPAVVVYLYLEGRFPASLRSPQPTVVERVQ